MENVKSKRRPVPQQDDVDLAIENMKHKWRYNPFRQFWWRYVVVFMVFFMVFSFVAPAWSSGGPGGVAQLIVQLAIQIAMSALFAIFFIYIQFFAIARPRVYWLKPYETGITFNDYKGNPQVLEMAREVVLLLKGSKQFKNMGGEYIRGLMLEGDPGVGKSYLAQAIASEAGLPFGYCSAPSLQSPFLAGGMLSVRALYKKARKFSAQYGGCILFLDEIDAIGQSRAGGNNNGGIGLGMSGMMGGGNTLINELLLQLDPPPVDERVSTRFVRWLGLEFKRKKAERPAVLTIAATNLVQTLDAALLRPGRFDRNIRVDKPDAGGRREVIEYYLDKVNHENIPIDRFVDETIGYSPVQIKYVINEALVRAHFNGRDAVSYPDLIEARNLMEVGLRQPIRGMTREDKRRIAYHETGHAIAQALLVPWERIVKLTIVRHGDALGFMQPKPIEEKHVMFKEEVEVDIQVSLASRAAEELFLGTGSLGFSGDLMNATERAYMLCANVGLNGHLSSAAVLGAPRSMYKDEVEAFLQDQMKKVKQLLEANIDMCHALAAELLEREELLGDDVMEIINRFPIKLTNDAKTKRRKIGFYHSQADGVKSNPGKVKWQEAPLAATGTDNAAPVDTAPAAYRPAPVAPTTARPIPTAQHAPVMPVTPPAPAPNYKVTGQAQASYLAHGVTGGLHADFIGTKQPPVVEAVVRPLDVTPAPSAPVVPPAPPVQPQPPVQVVKPAPAPQEDDDDDLLPKGW